jgi:hypothetical protein
MTFVMTPPSVSRPTDSGVTSSSTTSSTSPLSTPACSAAPIATTSSGLTVTFGPCRRSGDGRGSVKDHDGQRGPDALGVRDDLGLATLHHRGDHRVRGADIDSDSLAIISSFRAWSV